MVNKLIKTNFGILDRYDKDSWLPYYNMYINAESGILSIPDLANFLGIKIKLLRTILNALNLKPLSVSETSIRCNIKNKKTCLEKYGYETNLLLPESLKKSEEARISKYGDKCVFSNKDVIAKRDAKNIKKYGNKCTIHSDVMGKIMSDKYGNAHPMRCESIKNKLKNTNIKRYGVDNIFKNSEFIFKNKRKEHAKTLRYWYRNYIKINNYVFRDKFNGVYDRVEAKYIKYNFIHKDCGTEFQAYFTLSNIRCPKCYPKNKAKFEYDLLAYLKNNIHFDIKDCCRNTIPPYEIDIFLPELNIGFEYNGLYWHSMVHERISKDYHKNKTELALSKGIKLYHIWEHDNENIVKSMVLNKIGISQNKYYARKLKIKKVESKERQIFFDTNHLHGDVKSKLAYGLYDGDELVSCISFRSHKEGIEIARFATKLYSQCVGGFQKLLKCSISELKRLGYDKIITYCDRDWTPDYKDSVYYKNGFKFVKDTGCSLSYYDLSNKVREPREKYQKHKLKQLFPDNYKGTDVDEFLASKHIVALWNSGNWKFQLNI